MTGMGLNAPSCKWLLSIVLIGVGVSACGTQPQVTSVSASELSRSSALDQCAELYQKIDSRIDGAGVRDGGQHRPADFPYLRSNRFLASFAAELIDDGSRIRDWLSELRQLDRKARQIEMLNLGISPERRQSLLDQLDHCGQQMIEALSSDPQRELLAQQVKPPDDYSALQRTLGAYPLTVPFLKAGLSRYRASVSKTFERPLASLGSDLPLWLWRLSDQPLDDSEADSGFLKNRQRDFLGRWILSEQDKVRLARIYAPRFWIETADESDLLGAPVFGEDGPGVNFVENSVFYKTGYTRFNGQSYLQLSYVLWFHERPAKHALDPEAGKMDSVIWRVTLNEQGQVMLHDSIHSCGCYHFAFPTEDWLQRVRVKAEPDELLIPQPDAVRRGRVTVRLKSGTHAVQRVLGDQDVPVAKTRDYQLRSYADLLSIPAPGGQRRSLFDARGIVRGSERLERFWLWVSGIESPGAMRQWGRHATSFVGRTHFDDAFLLEKVFKAK